MTAVKFEILNGITHNVHTRIMQIKFFKQNPTRKHTNKSNMGIHPHFRIFIHENIPINEYVT